MNHAEFLNEFYFWILIGFDDLKKGYEQTYGGFSVTRFDYNGA